MYGIMVQCLEQALSKTHYTFESNNFNIVLITLISYVIFSFIDYTDTTTYCAEGTIIQVLLNVCGPDRISRLQMAESEMFVDIAIL
jgi:hypothetical protein